MKYLTSALVIVALLGAANAIDLKSHSHVKAGFTDDLVKSLAEDMQKDVEGAAPESLAEQPATTTAAAPAAATPAHKEEKKKDAKKTDKKADTKKAKPAAKKLAKKAEKADDEIPMDAAAIKAYSSVIADAAEDSEPAQAVIYHQTMTDDDAPKKSRDSYNPDPMASMIQNEISEIKDASIKAAKEASE